MSNVRTIHRYWVCAQCGGRNVFTQARVALNDDREEVLDRYYCADCKAECDVEEKRAL